MKCQYIQLSKPEWAHYTHTTPCIAKNIIERTHNILDTLSTEYTQKAFTDSAVVFTLCAKVVCFHDNIWVQAFIDVCGQLFLHDSMFLLFLVLGVKLYEILI